MIEISEKISINKTVNVVLCEMNTKVEKIVADILVTLHHIDPNVFLNGVSNILFITSESHDAKETTIDLKYFDEKIFTTAPKIPTVSAYKIDIEGGISSRFFQSYEIIIMGFFNCMSENIYSTVRNKNTGKKIFLFLDNLIDAPEYNNDFTRYSVNANMLMSHVSDEFRLSEKKRLNVFLGRLRKQNVDFSQMNQIPSMVSLSYGKSISTKLIDSFLSDHPTGLVVVPRRFLSYVNSYFKEDNSLDFNPGDLLYNKYPYVFESKNKGQVITIPAMSKIEIIKPGPDIVLELDGYETIGRKCDIKITYETEEYEKHILVYDAVIDFLSYLLNFDPESHPDSMEYFEKITSIIPQMNFREHNKDSTILTLVPYRIVSSDIPKYVTVDSILSFIETMERDIMYVTDSSYYKHFCKVKNYVEVVYSEEFTDFVS